MNVKRYLNKLLGPIGYRIIKHEKADKVMRLIQLLKPVDTGVELMRIGGNGDGGYLIPNDLEGIDYCFSPGVSNSSVFEKDIAKRGIHSFLADYSVDAPAEESSQFTFDKKFLGTYESDVFMTMKEWKENRIKDYAGDLLLQMDIEGSEYEVFANMEETLLAQFRIMVVEFHAFERFWDKAMYNLFFNALSKLGKHFYVVHLHPNNGSFVDTCGSVSIPCSLEITFLRKDRAKSVKPITTFPHPLDIDNIPNKPSIILPECWYANN